MALEVFNIEPQLTVATGADLGSPDVETPLPCTPDESSSTPVSLSSINFIGPITLLALLNVIVIFGNGLVVVAVFTQSQLRTVTNTFILSLAVSDMLLGIVVLPFSSANEILHYWVFGTIWCSTWLAVDVWLCTASILNLCAISLDRYLAISRPFRYPVLMSPSRAKLTVGLVWLLALAICSPPLLGWKTKSSSNATSEFVTQLNLNASAFPSDNPLFNFTTLTDDTETELGNYSTVFKPVVSGQPTEIIGVTTTTQDNNTYNINTFPCHTESSFYPTCKLNSDPGYIIYSALGSFWIPMLVMVFFYVKIYRTAVKASRALERGVVTSKSRKKSSSISAPSELRVHRGGGGNYAANEQHKLFRNGSYRMSSADVSSTSSARDDTEGENGTIPHPVGNGSVPRKGCRAVYEELPCTGSTEGVAARADRDYRTSNGNIGRLNRRRISRRQVPTALSRLNRETRAAKTVGIIVGCFIFCWAPFFTVYLLGAFCKDCTPKLVFSICFWLGYINSAINPLIYGLCSKQFRNAFYRLLCRRFRRRRCQMQVNMLVGELHPNAHSSVRSSSIISVT